MTIRPTGWTLEVLKFTTSDPVAHSALTGHWLNISNSTIGNGNILRISNLGVYTIGNANSLLGVGLNQYGVVKPMKGSANFKYKTDSINQLCEIDFLERLFSLWMCNNGTVLKLTEDIYSVLALDSKGLWRYEGYHGIASTDPKGRISVIRTMTNVNK